MAVKETDVENLFVLTSGPIPPNPAELLGSAAMEDLLAEAYEQFDVVLFDTPPVLAVTDAQILANQCDGVILVVHSGKRKLKRHKRRKNYFLPPKESYLASF